MSRSKYATGAGRLARGWGWMRFGLVALCACSSSPSKDPRVGELSASSTAAAPETNAHPGLGESQSFPVAQPSDAGHSSRPGAAGGGINPDAPLSTPSQPASHPSEPSGAQAGSEFPAMTTPVSTSTPGSSGPSEQHGGTPTSLRDTPIGDVPALDPDAVYIYGEDSEVIASNDSLYGLAALAAPDQGILGIPLFACMFLRHTDGHLVYCFQGSWSGPGVTSPLYEFRRDAPIMQGASADALTVGETVIERAELPCGPLAEGDSLRYRVAFDGTVYHTCGGSYDQAQRPPNETSYEAWYDAAGNRVYYGPLALSIVGANQRALFSSDDGTLHVLDLATGTELATVHLIMPAIVDRGFNGGASRSRKDGFWVASTSVDSMNPDATWTDINLEGQVTGEGSYPPMPEGVMMTNNNWTERWPVLDGQGALYQFAMDGDTGLIVRRPMQGPGEVVYRSSQWAPSDPHDVLPEQLITAN